MARRARTYRRPEMTLAQAYTQIRADYDAARTGRFRKRLSGVSAMGSGHDYHYRSEADYLRMMELARFIDRNDMVVGQGVTRLINNVLQDGIKYDPKSGDTDLNEYLAAKWAAWTQNPDACHSAGELTFHQIARLSLRHAIVDGDICQLALETGALEPVEAHRLRTPSNTVRNVVHGVLQDKHRRRLEYWFTKDDVSAYRTVSRVSDMERYPARDADGNRQVFHLYDPKRFSQTRGVTAFAPMVDPIGMHDDLQFANMVRAQIASCFAIFHEYDESYQAPAGAEDDNQKGERTTETRDDGSTRLLEGIAPGMEIFGAAGEKLKGFAPNVPNPEFFPHALMILTFIAINLNLPVAVLLLDPRQTNFSGWRGAIDQARYGFRGIQQWMIDGLHRPVVEWKIRQWLLEDRELRRLAGWRLDNRGRAVPINSKLDPFKHEWCPPRWPYIEPNKDSQADNNIIRGHLNSRRNVLARNGVDIDRVDPESVDDNVKLIRYAIEETNKLNADHPDAAVDWREVAGFDHRGRRPPAKGVSISDFTAAVRSGVRITEAEARTVLGLAGELPAGAAFMRFNDADLMEYHVRNPVVTIDEIRQRLGLKALPDGRGEVTPAERLAEIQSTRNPKGGAEARREQQAESGAEDSSEEEEVEN